MRRLPIQGGFARAGREDDAPDERFCPGVCIVRVDRDDYGLGVLGVCAEDLSVVFIHVSSLRQPSVEVTSPRPHDEKGDGSGLLTLFHGLGRSDCVPHISDKASAQQGRKARPRHEDVAGEIGRLLLADVGDRGQDVMTAPQALKDKGRDPGMIDGKMGRRTRAALADYQKAECLKVTSQLDDDTGAKLGM